MLKQATKDKLKLYGIDVDALIEAVTATEEKDLVIPEDITVIKNTDLEARDQNKLNEGKKLGESEGEKKGKELAAKAFKKKFSLEDNIPVDIDKVVEAVNQKLNKGDVALQEQVQALLKDKETLSTQLTESEGKAKQAGFEASLIGMFPSNRAGNLTDAERLTLLKMNLQFEEADGKTVVKRNGQIITDKASHSPLPLDKVIGDFFTEKGWVGTTNQGGRGGQDNTGGTTSGIKSASKFLEKYKTENPGKNEMSSDYIDALNKHAKEVTDFDMYN